MTKMHRGKKAAASLMAGILLCQMFVLVCQRLLQMPEKLQKDEF